MMKLILKPYETMKQVQATDRLRVDAGKVHDAVRTSPGLASKGAIADKTGLTLERVTQVIKHIQRGDTGHTRLEYGTIKARGGPHAGEMVTGWYAMDRQRHHDAMDQADEHSALVECGVRRSRLVRLVQAQGIRGADAVVASMEERLGLSVDAMSETDMEAFVELLTEAIEEGSEV